MELLQLKYFCYAAETQSFALTAKKFRVPPSDISQTVKRLERELGAELFDRRANRILLNDNGRRLLGLVRDAVSTLENAAFAFSQEKIGGTLRICINTNRRLVMGVVGKFRDLYPQVSLVIKCGAEPSSEEFDLIFTNEKSDSPTLRSQRMFSERILLAVNRSDPLATLERIGRNELADRDFIVMNERNSLWRITQEICAEMGFRPHVAIQGDDPFYIRKCVEMGLGISFVPSVSWQGQFDGQIVLRDVVDHKRDVYLLLAGDPPSPAASAFRDLFAAEVAEFNQ